jgi:hypothetical protein
MFNAIFNCLSESSKSRLKDLVPDFVKDVEDKKDALELWKAITSTHSLLNSGTKDVDQFVAHLNFVTARMHEGETTHAWRERIIRLKELNDLAGGVDIGEKQIAILYFRGLDSRFTTFKTDTLNDSVRGVSQIPDTLEKMYTFSNQYRGSLKGTETEGGLHVFAMNSKIDKKKKNGNK